MNYSFKEPKDLSQQKKKALFFPIITSEWISYQLVSVSWLPWECKFSVSGLGLSGAPSAYVKWYYGTEAYKKTCVKYKGFQGKEPNIDIGWPFKLVTNWTQEVALQFNILTLSEFMLTCKLNYLVLKPLENTRD